MPKVARSKRQKAGAGADIGDMIMPSASALHPVEHGKAAAGCFMTAGAKGAAGLDQKGSSTFRNHAFIGRCMDVEAPGMDRNKALLAHHQPVFVGQFLGNGQRPGRAGQPCLYRGDQLLVGLFRKIGFDLPSKVIERLYLFGDDGWHRFKQCQPLIILMQRFGLCTGAGQGDEPVHAINASANIAGAVHVENRAGH